MVLRAIRDSAASASPASGAARFNPRHAFAVGSLAAEVITFCRRMRACSARSQTARCARTALPFAMCCALVSTSFSSVPPLA